MTKERIVKKIEFDKKALDLLQEAYIALISANVQSYSIGSRSLTRLQLPQIKAEMESLEKEISELESLLNGGSRRRAVRVLPRDL